LGDPGASEITVSAEALSRNFGPLAAVREVSFQLKRGEVLGFLGPNGAGKTTTMQMLTGNLAPSSGGVTICGVDLLEQPVQAKARIGYLPETPPLYRELSVDEYLQLAAKLHRIDRPRRAQAVAEAKRRCGLADVGPRLIGTLSKGYQQRVGIAQAIVHEPDVVILDEPTIGLDPNQMREIRQLIREIGGSRSVILSTHILPEVETVCDRVQIMHQGGMVYSDTIAALKRFHGGVTIEIGLRAPPAPERLAEITGVLAVERASETVFRIQRDPERDPTDALVEQAVAGRWGLYRLAPAQTSLEDVFVKLTRGEDEA